MRRFIFVISLILVSLPGEASAELVSKLSTFAISTGTAGTTQTITVGFQPKFILCMWGGSTSGTDSVARGTMRRGIGFATGTTARRSIAGYSGDNAGTSLVARRTSNAELIEIINQSTGGADGAADLDAILSDGYRLIIDTQFSTAIQVSCLALGGDSLINADVGTLTMPGVTGEISVTSLAFQPNLMIMAGAEANAIPQGTNANTMFSIGAAMSSTQRATTAGSAAGAQPTSLTCRYSTDAEASSIITPLSGCPVNRRIDFVEFLSNGFTVDRLEWPDQRINVWAALEIEDAFIGSFSTRTDTNQISVSGLGFRPSSILFFSNTAAESTQDTAEAHDIVSMGAATGSSEQMAHATRDENGAGDTIVSTGIEHDSVYLNPTASAKQGSLQLTSITSDGFTAAMDDPDPSAAFVWYLAFGPGASSGTTHNPADGNSDTLNTLINSEAVSDGDTIIIPNGNWSWDSRITVTKGIIIRGESEAGVVITDDSTETGIGRGMSVTLDADQQFRLTTMTFESGIDPPNNDTFYAMAGRGTVRLDHLTITGWPASDTWGSSTGPIGVVDNVSWTGNWTLFFVVKHLNWNGVADAGSMGHASWAEPTNFGSEAALYFEDNNWNNDDPGTAQVFVEGNGGGGRVVVRFNQIDCYYIGGHGADSGGQRSFKQKEVYRNDYTRESPCAGPDAMVSFRGGTGLVFDNTVVGQWTQWVKLWTERADANTGDYASPVSNCSGGCGRNYWDANDTVGVATGTMTTGTNSTTIEVSGSPGWTTNQWVRYTLRDTTTGSWGPITANDSNTLTIAPPSNSSTRNFNSGDSFEINLVTYVLDQPGRGQSTLVTFEDAADPTSAVNVGNALEPIYVFRNTGTATSIGMGITADWLVENRDYYRDDSLEGVKVATTLAGCPSADLSDGMLCWVTDEGTWNQTAGTPGGQGRAYQRQGGAWVLWYTPAIYPHPIRTSGFLSDAGGSMPTSFSESLRIQVR